VLVIDDVITAGTAIRETMAILQPAGASVVGLVLALDRQERMSDASELSAVQVPNWAIVGRRAPDLRIIAFVRCCASDLTALQSVTEEFHIPVWSICKLEDLMAFVQQAAIHPESNIASKVCGMHVFVVQHIQLVFVNLPIVFRTVWLDS
jgi:orotate phosphoribosyltransferase